MIVGREAERGELARALADARDSVTRSLLVVGDAGMGKSTLLRACEHEARSQGFHVVGTASPEGSSQFRYAVVEDIARGMGASADALDPEDAALLRGLHGAGSVGPSRVATALLHLLVAPGTGKPVLLLLDDLHWADSASLAALTLAVGRLRQHPVMVLGAARPRPATDPRLYSWARMDLGPLDWQAAIDALRCALPEPLNERVPLQQADRVVTALGRHPLAIAECTRLLTEAQIAGTQPIPEPIPLDDRLLDAWGGAFDELPERTRDSLVALCTIRATAPSALDHVLAECGLCRADLDPAVAARLVAPVPTASRHRVPDVAHPLIAAAILARVDSAQVRRMHARAAAAARTLGLGPEVISTHIAAAAERGDRTAIEAICEQAGRAAESDRAATAARALLEAAELATSGAERGELASRGARMLLSMPRDLSGAGPLVDFLAGTELTPEQRVWANWLRAEHLAERDLRACLAALCNAADHAEASGSPALPSILWSATYSAWAVGDGPVAITLARRYARWEATADTRARASLPMWSGHALMGLTSFQIGDVARAETHLATARAMAQRWSVEGEPEIGQLASVVALDQAIGMQRPANDARLQDALRRLVGDSGESLAFLRNIQAARALQTGDVLAARSLVDEGLDLSRAVQSTPNIVLRLCTAVRIDAMTGDTHAMRTEAAELRRLAGRLGHASGLTFANRAQGLLALGEGRLDDALGFLEPLTEDLLLGTRPADPVCAGRADLVEALARSGDLARALRVSQALHALLADSTDPHADGLLARCRGLVSASGAGIDDLEAALAAFQAAEDAFEVARTRLILGEHLRRDRRAPEARRELRAAVAEFERMGALPWLARARGELRATGSAVASARLAGPALTAQESRVAQAVAQGMSNREVAAALFVSPRTVEHHLASAYRKLGVTSRTALARCLTGTSATDGVAAR